MRGGGSRRAPLPIQPRRIATNASTNDVDSSDTADLDLPTISAAEQRLGRRTTPPRPRSDGPSTAATGAPRWFGLAGLLTILLVARSLLGSTALARTDPTMGLGSLILQLLTFLSVAYVGIFGALVGKRLQFGGLLSLLFTGIAALTLVSASLSGYVHPGIYATWEWLSLAGMLILAANLPHEARPGMLAVLLACLLSQSLGILLGEISHAFRGPDFRSALPVAMTAFPAIAILLLPYLMRMLLAAIQARMGISILLATMLLIVVAALTIPIPGIDPTWSEARQTAWQRIAESPWLGFGPGNDLAALTVNWPATSDQPPTPAQSFWLTLTLTVGIPATGLLLLVGLIPVLRAWRIPTAPTDHPETTISLALRREFTIAGMIGLLLGFVLAVTDLPTDSGKQIILRAGLIAAFRGLLWFGTFTLYESLELAIRPLARSLALGIVGVMGLLALQDASGSLAALTPVAVILGLLHGLPRAAATIPTDGIPAATTDGSASTTASNGVPRPGLLRRILSAAIVFPWWVGFLMLALIPASMSLGAMQRIRAEVIQKVMAEKRTWIELATPADKPLMAAGADNYLQRGLIQPLANAVYNDPSNAKLRQEHLRMLRERWDFKLAQAVYDPKGNSKILNDATQLGKLLGDRLAELQAIDQVSAETYELAFETWLHLAKNSKAKRPERFQLAEQALQEVIRRDPSRELSLRRDLLEVWFTVGDPDEQRIAYDQGITLLKRDHQAPGPRFRLKPDQRTTLLRRLGDPSPELLQAWLETGESAP
ncbi:hypothetical protein [Tuwongella immobilis]|uniref:Uncharacterized protein n=1 Tax=Tuwongella immobilis TaxID=692036 RepID=A0A6C2YI06_9BACT|nr:hypothetical protein [Tuwongella immobilis]VIP01057.1 unnamed protein product [Tuwongella immobilis]VTR97539.1 unnamed protein product [Tuwongella immobilis]